MTTRDHRPSSHPRQPAADTDDGIGFTLLVATLVAVAAGLVLAGPAHGWGATGHRVVGAIAADHVEPATAAAIEEILGPESLARAGTWADEIRSDPAAWGHASTWHYVNVPEGGSWESAEKNPSGDVIQAIRCSAATVADASAPAAERAVALRFLAHFVADLHQPLHAGFAHDRGGNEVRVTWHGEPSNLHRVWDSDMIRHVELSYTEMVGFVDRVRTIPAGAVHGRTPYPTPEELDAWRRSGPIEWMDESRELLRGAYDIGDGRLSWRYSYDHFPTVERRLHQAGVRLAAVLDRILPGDSVDAEAPPPAVLEGTDGEACALYRFTPDTPDAPDGP